MPGLLRLRPLASAAAAAKSNASKNAVSAARTEKVRDDRSQGKSSPFARARVLKAPAVLHTAPTPPPVPAGVQPCRPKQGTDAVGEAGKETLRGTVLDINQRMHIDYSSSGSEHEHNSVCLAEMVFDYIEENLNVGKCGRARCNCNSSCAGEPSLLADNDDTKSSLGRDIIDVLQSLIFCASASERIISAAVASILDAWTKDEETKGGSDNKVDESARSSLMRRWVMTALRTSGYNAAICKSRWAHAGGLPGGDYEYIDVILPVVGGKSERVLIDLDFRSQFEIARPTTQYGALLQSLPSYYVGNADRLQQIVNIMCDAAKRSLKKKGMPLPPWRKPEYIKAKWFSSYRRTTNEVSLSSSKSRSGSNISRIALGGSGWDSNFTKEMEKCYHKAADVRNGLQECITEADSSKSSKPAILQKHHIEEPEGKVRGANLLGFLGCPSSNVATPFTEVTDAATEWEPPVVIPRATQRGATFMEESRELRGPPRPQGALSQLIAMANN